MSLSNHPVVRHLLAGLDRLVVVGGTSVGKTTLINHWLGGEEPVGVGGMTTTPVVHTGAQHTLIDTPSLDQQPDLYPWVVGCDVLVWVIDGLRPIGHTEHEAVQQLATVSGSVVGIVSRADLLPEEDRAAVLTRCQRHCPGPVLLADLRRSPPSIPRIDRMHTRRVAIDQAVEQRVAVVRSALEGIDAWRQLCRTTPVVEAASAIAHLRQRLISMAQEHGWEDPPELPMPRSPDVPSGWRDVLGGTSRRTRQQASSAASWFRDGHVLLLDWLAPLGDEQGMRSELEQLQRGRVERGSHHSGNRP